MTLKAFLSDPGRVIITDRVANINRLMRRWNRHDGMDIVDCSVLSLSQVAKELVLAYAGVYEHDRCYRVISPAMRTMIMQVIVKNAELASIPEESKGMRTTAEILRSLDQIRLNDPTEAFLNGTEQKLVEMRDLISAYEARLRGNDELDTPLLLKKATECLDALIETGNAAKTLSYFVPWITGEVGIPAGAEWTEAEKRLIDRLEKAAGKTFARDLSVSEEKDRRPEYHFFESYGIAGEVRYVTDRIKEKNIHYGDVAVIYAGEAYENMLRGELENAGIPYAFPKGMHASSEDHVAFMLDLLRFVEEDYSYQSLVRVITNPVCSINGGRKAYRSILNAGIGWGRERYTDYIVRACNEKGIAIKSLYSGKDETDDRTDDAAEVAEQPDEVDEQIGFITFLKNVVEAFSPDNSCEKIYNGLLQIARRYTRKKDPARIALSDSFKAQSRAFSVVAKDETFENKLSLIKDYLTDLRYTVSESPDAVVIYPYGDRMVTDRRVLFILGMSNENVAGTRAESPVFSDAELEKYVKSTPDLASKRNSRRRKALEYSLECFAGTDVYVGYSEYDTVKLLDNSRAHLYSELMRENGVSEEDVEKTGYDLIKGAVSVSKDDLYRAYKRQEESKTGINENDAGIDETETAGTEASGTEQFSSASYFSASSLQSLLHCPLQFYYKKIEHVPDVQFVERRPDRWLQPNQKGNLFHNTMEDYVNEALVKNEINTVDEKLLERLFEENVEKLLREQPCPSDAVFESEREESWTAIRKYAARLHREIAGDASGKKVIGCEVRFDKYPYSGGLILPGANGVMSGDHTYTIYFSGSADRVDGYVQDGILNLGIIDYKTGSRAVKQGEIDAEVQIQHFVYAICVRQWALEHIKELEERFGQTISTCRIASMRYVFPFDEEAPDIDATKYVTDEELRLPEGVDQMLSLTVGAVQHGDMKGAMMFMQNCVSNMLAQDKEQDKADHCRYCGYTDVCRMKL